MEVVKPQITKFLSMKSTIWVILICLLSNSSWGQNTSKRVTAKYIYEVVILDGLLYELAWQTAEVAGDFQQFFPSDQVTAQYPVQVKILYSETHLYVGVHVFS